jgi:hypothetical protein
VSLHQPSPLDAPAAPDQAAQPAKAAALAGGFEAPAGFVLKGAPLLLLKSPSNILWS